MPNSFKRAGGSDYLALQVTRPVRQAQLVDEQPPEDTDADTNPPYPTYRAPVRSHAFDGVMLALDRDRIPNWAQAELVAQAITETQSVFRAIHSTVIIQGEGYMLQLPHAAEAGFQEGDPAPVKTAPNLLVIHEQSEQATQVAENVVSLRQDQVE